MVAQAESYFHRRRIVVLSVLLVVALFSFAYFFMHRTPSEVGYGRIPNSLDLVKVPVGEGLDESIKVQSPLSQPSSAIFCARLDGMARVDCYNRSLESMGPPEMYSPGLDKVPPGMGQYAVYDQVVAESAAMMDDPHVCDRLGGDRARKCVSSIPELRAILSKDVSSCDRYSDDRIFLRCYSNAIEVAGSESRVKAFRAAFPDPRNLSVVAGSQADCDSVGDARVSRICGGISTRWAR